MVGVHGEAIRAIGDLLSIQLFIIVVLITGGEPVGVVVWVPVVILVVILAVFLFRWCLCTRRRFYLLMIGRERVLYQLLLFSHLQLILASEKCQTDTNGF